MKIIKSCGVRFRREGIYVFSHVNTSSGLATRIPFLKLDSKITPELLGQRVFDALRSVPDVFEEINLREFRSEYANYLLQLGFQNERSFARAVPFLLVILEDNIIKVIPHESDNSGAQLPLHEKTRSCLLDTDVLGRLIVEQSHFCIL